MKTLMKSAADRKCVETEMRTLSTKELDVVTGAAVRYYVMGGYWYVCGKNRNGDPCAVNTGIPAE